MAISICGIFLLAVPALGLAPVSTFAGSSRVVASVHRGQPEMGLVSRLVGPALCAVVGAIAGSALSKKRAEPSVYTMADQVARFAKAKAEGNKRVLDIDAFYDPSKLAGKRVLVTGANRGIGLALATQLQADGATVIATCRQSSAELDALKVAQVITGIDVTQDADMAPLVAALAGSAVDVVVNNAGYFYGPVETLTSLNFGEQLKQIDICALGPLRVSAALVNAGLVATGGKVVMITSQGGSVAWRDVQNPTGHDYGHHMSKSAANMMSALLAKELAGKGIAVLILHPGFNKTDMTAKYKAIWEVEGAVDVGVGAKRVLHEVGVGSMATSGKFINCEDGLQIPF